MKTTSKFFTLLFILVLTLTQALAQTNYKTVTKTSNGGKFTYQTVEGDPTQTRFYTLKNGLTVILHENRTEPRIMALITTKAGGKNDPAQNTGLAHYLEHLLFKGTDELGTADYNTELTYLQQIEDLYEVYNKTTDEADRTTIYHKIDSISGLAAKYAIPNEYDKAMAEIGSNMTNAFTSFEMTAYMENFPSNNLEKYLMVQDERFEDPVFRLFHTELETVYEEKNISLDDGGSKVFDAIFAGLFKNHPYGTQTILGTVDHLKNPSIQTIRNFFKQYYVPNNMAVILSGDLDYETAVSMVDHYFGDWKPAQIPEFTFKPENEILTQEEFHVTSPDEESVAIGFRMPDKNHPDVLVAELTSALLYNGKTGLIDKNLVQAQMVLDAYGFEYLLKDYGLMYFGGSPLEGQSLSDVKKLILEQINLLKSGNFDDDLILATVNNLKVNTVYEQDNAVNMAFTLNDLFSTDTRWQDYLLRADKMSLLSKKEVVEFANKWFKANYIAVYKETGSDNTIQKIQKPQITPIEINRSSVSDFLNKIKDTPSKPLQPVFLDYQKDIQFGSRHRDVPIWLVPNKMNQLFTFSYVFDMGSYHDQKLPIALEYLNYIGSEHKSLEQINKELYKLAVNYKIYATTEQVYISLSGLEEHFEKALAIIDDLIRNPKPDQEALNKLVESMIKERMDNTLNKDIIFRSALSNYADYGPINPFNQVISNEDLRKIQASELTQLVKSLFTYKHKVFYFGPRSMEDLSQYLRKTYGLKSRLNGYPQPRQFTKISPEENTVYFVDYDMVQTEIGFQRWDEPFDPGRMPIISAFNEYYGGGMSSIVFQEIREAKALAYSTYGFYSNPAKKEDPYKAGFYVGTQSDKLTEAFDAMITLMENMPEAEENWNVCKQLIQQNIEANRITKNSILYNYQSALRLGFNHDYRKDIYEQTEGISLMDIKKFHQEHMANKKWNIRVIGSKAKLDFEALSNYGKVVELSLEDVFGYKIEK